VKASDTLKNLVPIYKTTWCHVPEDSNPSILTCKYIHLLYEIYSANQPFKELNQEICHCACYDSKWGKFVELSSILTSVLGRGKWSPACPIIHYTRKRIPKYSLGVLEKEKNLFPYQDINHNS